MNEIILRGYVTPEDFTGTDAQKVQAALDYAETEDIRKVVIAGTYRADSPITVPANMHLVLESGTLYADLSNQRIVNYSFEQDRIFIQGKCGKLVGNIAFYNARHAVIESMQIEGNVTAEFTRDSRIENSQISGTLTLGKGCANIIAQYLEAKSVVISSRPIAEDVPGRDRTTRNIVLRSSTVTKGVTLLSAEDWGLLNIQADHIKSTTAAVTIGSEGEALPAGQYKNLTFTDLDTPVAEKVVANNPYMHAYIV